MEVSSFLQDLRKSLFLCPLSSIWRPHPFLGLWPPSIFKASNGLSGPSSIAAPQHWHFNILLLLLRILVIILGTPGYQRYFPYFELSWLVILILPATFAILNNIQVPGISIWTSWKWGIILPSTYTKGYTWVFFFFLFYWSIVDLHCCDHRCYSTKWFSCPCTHIHAFSDFFPI